MRTPLGSDTNLETWKNLISSFDPQVWPQAASENQKTFGGKQVEENPFPGSFKKPRSWIVVAFWTSKPKTFPTQNLLIAPMEGQETDLFAKGIYGGSIPVLSNYQPVRCLLEAALPINKITSKTTGRGLGDGSWCLVAPPQLGVLKKVLGYHKSSKGGTPNDL